ncbi:hypothetical protein BRC97_08960 [Halobacteriales archaeon QS_6_71_20]|nr:MAG: hypothetical protein BRC97_08960 [Halobacteriales archaeon QS_6_71_20]
MKEFVEVVVEMLVAAVVEVVVVVEVFVAVVMEVFVDVVTEVFVSVVTESVDDGVAVAVFVVSGDPVSVVPGGSVPVADAVEPVEPVVSPLGNSPDDPDSVPVASGGSVVDSGGVRVGVGLSLGVAEGLAVGVVVRRSAVPEAFDVPLSAPVAPTGCSMSDTASSGITGVPPKTAHPINGDATNTRANTMTCDGLRSPGCIPAPPAPPVIVIRSASPRLAR